ncbi:hypothetical protein BJV82DRAFT_615305 [Fennellomyces sp. T-0311]|nr:hypothetical protein BJV82DRAFT_615305 [Fennellomyces sp. T-0311]
MSDSTQNLSRSRLQRFLERKRGVRPVPSVDRMVFLPVEEFERRQLERQQPERAPTLSFESVGSASPPLTPVRDQKRKLRESFVDMENSIKLSEEHVKKMARIQRGLRAAPAPYPTTGKFVIKPYVDPPSRQSSSSVTGSTSSRRQPLGDKTMENSPYPATEELVLKPYLDQQSRRSSPSVTGSTSSRRRPLGDKSMENSPYRAAEELVLKPYLDQQSSPSVTGSTSSRLRPPLGEKPMANRAESIKSYHSNDNGSFKSLKSFKSARQPFSTEQTNIPQQKPRQKTPIHSFFAQHSTQKEVVSVSQQVQDEEEEVLTSFSAENETAQPPNKDTQASVPSNPKDPPVPSSKAAASKAPVSDADDQLAKAVPMQQPSDINTPDNLDADVEEDGIANDVTAQYTDVVTVEDATAKGAIVETTIVQKTNMEDVFVEETVQPRQQADNETAGRPSPAPQDEPLPREPATQDDQDRPTVNDDIDFEYDYGDQYDNDDNHSRVSHASSVHPPTHKERPVDYERRVLSAEEKADERRKILESIRSVQTTYQNQVLERKLTEFGTIASECADKHTSGGNLLYDEATIALGERMQQAFNDHGALIRKYHQLSNACVKLAKRQNVSRTRLAKIHAQRSKTQGILATMKEMHDKVDHSLQLLDDTHSFLSDLCNWSADQSK